VNIFERENFELYTTEYSIYDTTDITYKSAESKAAGSVSPVFSFLNNAIPVHDHVTVRIKAGDDITEKMRDRIIIKNVSGTRSYVQKADWQNGWLSAKFRQFGTYQAFIDDEAPTVNNPPSDLSKTTRLVFTPKDNFNAIKSFRAELDNKWLCFTNDKGRTWIYRFDEKFPKGEHELKLTIEDEAGNVLVKTWKVKK
jgi:hypothetical protein